MVERGETLEIKIPLKQHIGGISTPIVKTGDEIMKGQLIAISNGLGANIHSSVYGKVVEINNVEVRIEVYENQPDNYIKISNKVI